MEKPMSSEQMVVESWAGNGTYGTALGCPKCGGRLLLTVHSPMNPNGADWTCPDCKAAFQCVSPVNDPVLRVREV